MVSFLQLFFYCQLINSHDIFLIRVLGEEIRFAQYAENLGLAALGSGVHAWASQMWPVLGFM